jgi:hypothetical protein
MRSKEFQGNSRSSEPFSRSGQTVFFKTQSTWLQEPWFWFLFWNVELKLHWSFKSSGFQLTKFLGLTKEVKWDSKIQFFGSWDFWNSFNLIYPIDEWHATAWQTSSNDQVELWQHAKTHLNSPQNRNLALPIKLGMGLKVPITLDRGTSMNLIQSEFATQNNLITGQFVTSWQTSFMISIKAYNALF